MADDRAAAGASLFPPPRHSEAQSNPPPDVSSFTHTPFYCEENVYLLCKELIRSGIADPAGTDLYVVFISNEEKKLFTVGIWFVKKQCRPELSTLVNLPSAVDNFRRQFANLEENGGKSGTIDRKHVSLPSEESTDTFVTTGEDGLKF